MTSTTIFTFERSRFITTFNKTTSISTIREIFTKNLPASNSGRTLSEILSISHPNDLDSYTISNKGVVVAYSCEDGVEFHRKRADDLDREKRSLKKKLSNVHQEMQILVEWQTANLVLHAFAEFAWDYVSNPDKNELKLYEIFNFLDLYYARFAPNSRPKRNVSSRIYRKFPGTLHDHTDYIMNAKLNVSTGRKQLAHPVISQEELDNFLQRLQVGDGTPNLDPLDIAVLNYLKITSISEDNVKRAAGRERD